MQEEALKFSLQRSQLIESAWQVRHGYALRPDLHVLVEALLTGGFEALRKACQLHLGVPMQPMLAKACTSVEELLKRVKGSMPKCAARLCAEFKPRGAGRP